MKTPLKIKGWKGCVHTYEHVTSILVERNRQFVLWKCWDSGDGEEGVGVVGLVCSKKKELRAVEYDFASKDYGKLAPMVV